MYLSLAPLFSVSLTLASLAAGAAHHFQAPAYVNQTSVGHAVVINECSIPVYVWSVGQNVSPQTVVQSGQNYTEPFRRDMRTGGIAIKITTSMNGLYTSAPQTVFAYNLVDNVVWYDLSDVFGDPFMGERVTLLPSEPVIRWEEGVPPRGSQVRMQDALNDLILTLC